MTTYEEPPGAVLGFSMVSHDVTARWKSEEHLRISEGRFRALLTYVQQYALIMLDPHGRVSTWSAEAERVSGYTDAEILGLPSAVFYTAQDLALNKPYQDLALARAQGRYEFEDWRIRKGGARVWTHVVITALLDPFGTLLGFSEVTRDISARKRTMDALERRAEEFRQSNTDLEQSIWAAVRDLQEPLHLIASSTALLATQYAGRLDADGAELIGRAVEETHRMQRVIHDLFACTHVAGREHGLPRHDLQQDGASGSGANDRFLVGGPLPRHSFSGGLSPNAEVPPSGIAAAGERI